MELHSDASHLSVSVSASFSDSNNTSFRGWKYPHCNLPADMAAQNQSGVILLHATGAVVGC
jgi:hypothetical protein